MKNKLFSLSAIVMLVAIVAFQKNELTVAFAGDGTAAEAKYFQNPLVNQGRPDPFIAQKDGNYYVLATKGNRIAITKTKAMSQLGTATETVVWKPEADKEYSKNIWAPELYYLDGKWYLYFAADNGDDKNHRMYVLENASEDPTKGDWTFKGKISDASDQWAIDGSVLVIGKKRYFIWSGWENVETKWKQHIYLAAMSNPWTIEGPRVKISSPTNDWERYEHNGVGSTGVNEGPIALQKDAKSPVFIIYSASRYNSDNYCLAQLELKKGADPTSAENWINKKQVFVKSDANAVYGPGHNGFFTSRGINTDGSKLTETWFVYHARSIPNAGNGQRTARMQKLNWNKDGSPDFGTALAVGTDIQVPIGE